MHDWSCFLAVLHYGIQMDWMQNPIKQTDVFDGWALGKDRHAFMQVSPEQHSQTIFRVDRTNQQTIMVKQELQ